MPRRIDCSRVRFCPQRGGGAPAAFDIRPQPSLKRPTESVPAIAQAQSVERDWRAGPADEARRAWAPTLSVVPALAFFSFRMRLGTRAGRRGGPRSPLSAGGPGRKRAFERPALAELGDGRAPAGAFEAHTRRRQRRPFNRVISFGRSIVIYTRQSLEPERMASDWTRAKRFLLVAGTAMRFRDSAGFLKPKLKPSK